jgi:hypothetical protein
MHEQTKKDIFQREREKLGKQLMDTPDVQNPENAKANELFQKIKDLNWVMGRNETSPHYKAPRKPTFVKTYK